MIDYQPLLDSERVRTHQQDTLAESRGLVGIHLVAIYKALGGWLADAARVDAATQCRRTSHLQTVRTRTA